MLYKKNKNKMASTSHCFLASTHIHMHVCPCTYIYMCIYTNNHTHICTYKEHKTLPIKSYSNWGKKYQVSICLSVHTTQINLCMYTPTPKNKNKKFCLQPLTWYLPEGE